MSTQLIFYIMKNEELFEKIKKKFNIHEDKDVAKVIGLSPQNFSDWKTGKRKLPARAIVNAWDALGYAVTRDMLLSLLGDVGEKIKEMDNKRAQKRAKKNGDKEAD